MTYRKRKKLGDGGFGEVWECTDEGTGGTVDLKFLTSDSEDAVRRFQRETRILAELKHPRILRILASSLDGSPYFYVMPCYAGSLRDRLPSIQGNNEAIRDIFSQILDGLEYAHDGGVIHRDLKPENVLVDGDGTIVISDFGLGRIVDAQTSRLTLTGDVFGTLAYMAPEQLRDSKRTDHRSDIFSLGILLRELYTGEPFPSTETAPVPAAISVIIERCTHSDPSRRYQSVAELRSAFETLGTGVKRASAEQELSELTKRVADQGTSTDADIEQLVSLIAECEDNSDLMHNLAVTIPAATFRSLYQMSPETAKLLIKRFSESCSSTSFDFDYTDKIGSACRRLFGAVSDPELRASITLIALEVGVSHSRYYVMEVAGNLIEAAKENKEAVALFGVLEPLRSHLAAIETYIKPNNLHPIIRTLFESQEN